MFIFHRTWEIPRLWNQIWWPMTQNAKLVFQEERLNEKAEIYEILQRGINETQWKIILSVACRYQSCWYQIGPCLHHCFHSAPLHLVQASGSVLSENPSSQSSSFMTELKRSVTRFFSLSFFPHVFLKMNVFGNEAGASLLILDVWISVAADVIRDGREKWVQSQNNLRNKLFKVTYSIKESFESFCFSLTFLSLGNSWSFFSPPSFIHKLPN